MNFSLSNSIGSGRGNIYVCYRSLNHTLFFGHTYALVKMVTLDEEILKCMMDQNLSSVKTFVQLMFTDIKNEGFTQRKHGT